jgi:hypothetical protein
VLLGKKNEFLPVAETRTPNHPVRRLVTEPTEPSLLLNRARSYNNNNNNLLTASGLSPGGSGYFTFKLRQTY